MAISAREYKPKKKGVQALLTGPEVTALVKQRAEDVATEYRRRVAKRTGRLAARVRVHTEIAGKSKYPGNVKRAVGVVTAFAPYAVAHEFGNKRSGPGSGTLKSVVEDMAAR